jgi:anti-anti-sigma regulatory factor
MAIYLDLEKKPKTLVFSGLLDESLNPEAQILQAMANANEEIDVDCSGITRINSSGVKQFISFFNRVKEKQIRFQFLRVSPVMVEQFNIISNFGGGGKVVSAGLPFRCKACEKTSVLYVTKSEALSINLDKVTLECSNCKKRELDFDDLPDEYLEFWKK